MPTEPWADYDFLSNFIETPSEEMGNSPLEAVNPELSFEAQYWQTELFEAGGANTDLHSSSITQSLFPGFVPSTGDLDDSYSEQPGGQSQTPNYDTVDPTLPSMPTLQYAPASWEMWKGVEHHDLLTPPLSLNGEAAILQLAAAATAPPAPQSAAPPAAPGKKRRGRPLGVKNSRPRRAPGEKKRERDEMAKRGELRRPGRPPGRTDGKERAKAGQGPNYEYLRQYRAKKAAEKKQQGNDDDDNNNTTSSV